MKWAIPLGTGGVILAPLIVVSIVSGISPYFIWDNPEFWYGYMGYVGTVALAGAALWQNQSFRLESKRKEEYAIRPYLFSEIVDSPLDVIESNEAKFLQVDIDALSNYNIVEVHADKPPDIVNYFIAKQKAHNFIIQPVADNLRNVIQSQQKVALVYDEAKILVRLKRKYILCSYSLENHGAGSAVKIKWLIGNRSIIPMFCLSHGEKKRLHILINAEQLQAGNTVEFNIAIEFYNIEDFGPYVQKEKFSILRTGTDQLSLSIDKQISSPVLEKKEASTDDKT